MEGTVYLKPIVYQFCDARIELRSDRPEAWTVTRDGLCLAKDGELEFEPMPSNRDDAFIQRTRYGSLALAAKAAAEYFKVNYGIEGKVK